MSAKKENTMSVVSLVMGLLSLPALCGCFGLPFNILGVIFSIIGLRQIRKHPAQTGRGMALGGLGLSLLSLLLAVALVALVMLIGFENIMRGLRKSRFFGR